MESCGAELVIKQRCWTTGGGHSAWQVPLEVVHPKGDGAALEFHFTSPAKRKLEFLGALYKGPWITVLWGALQGVTLRIKGPLEKRDL